MEEYKGLIIPEILKPDELGVCDGGDIHLQTSQAVDCDGISCQKCVFDYRNEDIAKEYLRTLGKHTPLNKCFNKENNMNTNISNVFDKTKEALLVEKHLGHEIKEDFLTGLILADKKEDVLKEAKRLEKEEKDK